MASIRTPVWLDCDPGHDDALAIILAAEHPSLDLLGISTVHGNASVGNVTNNALSLLTAIGRTDIPVYGGSRKPFMRAAVHAPAIHGESGIDGTNLLPTPTAEPKPGSSILAMREAIMKTPPQSCAVVATGALTNIALLFATFPEVATHIRRLSVMGGAFGDREDTKGNITKWAEFNIYCDPESAQSVFSNPNLSDRITLVPLDLTHLVLATPDVLGTLLAHSQPPSNLRKMLHDLLTFFAKQYADVFNLTAGPPTHDPLAVAAVIPTDEIKWSVEEVAIDVSCHGPEIGKTTKTPKSGARTGIRGGGLGHGGVEPRTWVNVAKTVDTDAFWRVLMTCVDKADGRYDWVR